MLLSFLAIRLGAGEWIFRMANNHVGYQNLDLIVREEMHGKYVALV